MLLISVPNITNPNFFTQALTLNEKKLINWSKHILENYKKSTHHIQAWDAQHFIMLLSSCGYELVKYQPSEGILLPYGLKRIPLIGKFIPTNLHWNIPIIKRWCYTNIFLFRKVKEVEISIYD